MEEKEGIFNFDYPTTQVISVILSSNLKNQSDSIAPMSKVPTHTQFFIVPIGIRQLLFQLHWK